VEARSSTLNPLIPHPRGHGEPTGIPEAPSPAPSPTAIQRMCRSTRKSLQDVTWVWLFWSELPVAVLAWLGVSEASVP